jgi:ferrochelatase
LVVPISFVSDHVEMLKGINIEVRAEATELGITRFEMMPGLNDSPKFIQALAELVFQTIGWPRGVGE